MTITTNQKISIPSIHGKINIVENLIDEIKKRYNISEDVYGNMLVAVTEAVNNAIVHGNQENPEKKVQIEHQLKDNCIHFVISDEGCGFDHFSLPDPTAPENIQKPCGRGVYLMKHLSNQIIFSDNGRTVEMYFKLAPLLVMA